MTSFQRRYNLGYYHDNAQGMRFRFGWALFDEMLDVNQALDKINDKLLDAGDLLKKADAELTREEKKCRSCTES